MGSIIDTEFVFEDERFEAEGKVLRISLIERVNNPLFKLHIQFIGFESGQQDKLVRKVFETQRKLQNDRGGK